MTIAVCAMLGVGGSAAAQTVLDSAQVQMTGVIEDVCSVDGITAVTPDNLDNFTSSTIGAGVKVATLGFGFPLQNTNNPSALTIGAIENGGIDVDIDLYCNGTFQFTIEAARGAMVNADGLTNAADFTNALTYTVDFTFPDGSTAPTTVSSGAPGVIVFDPAVPAQDGSARLSIQFTNPAGRKLISGLYEEALTVSFVQDGTAPPTTFSP